MLVLDENLPSDQRQLLRKWRIRFRAIGVNLVTSGTPNENLIPVFHALPAPTFFTLDRNFYRRAWAHENYCLVWLDAPAREAADFIRRFLRHSNFDTASKRMGVVARVHFRGIEFWRMKRRISVTWASGQT
jgi:hypothetical protein